MSSYFDTAKAVINAAYERGVTVGEVLAERYPYSRGGVGHANRLAKVETMRRMREWLEPGERDEPNGMRA